MSTTTAPAPATDRTPCGVLARSLRQEWDVIQDQPLGSWRVGYPALAPLRTPAAVLEALRRAGNDAATTDRLLLPLLEQAAAGSDQAARTALQAMLPRVSRLERMAIARHIDDPEHASLESMWACIRSYPQHRTRRVAANLAMDALKRLGGPDWDYRRARTTRAHAPQLVSLEARAVAVDETTGQRAGLAPGEHRDLPEDLNDRSNPAEQAAREATELLAWAQDSRVLTTDEVQLLARWHLSGETLTWSEVAHELGISCPAARKRHSRAVHRLADAVRERMS